MNDPNALRNLIVTAGQSLSEKITWANPIALLGALAENESTWGINRQPRHEMIFHPGGRYCQISLHAVYGCWACCAYSSFQLQYSVAVELGCPLPPEEFRKDENAIHWVLEFIDKRILKQGCVTIEDFADAYNSGSFKDNLVPLQYVSDFVAHYNSVVERRGLTIGG